MKLYPLYHVFNSRHKSWDSNSHGHALSKRILTYSAIKTEHVEDITRFLDEIITQFDKHEIMQEMDKLCKDQRSYCFMYCQHFII